MEYYIGFMVPEDWEQVRTIFQQGIDTGNATYDTSVASWTTWDADHCQDCRLSVKSGDEVLGWAALTAVSKRKVYQGVFEVSIYIKESCRRQGVGTALMSALIRSTEEHGIWTLQSQIFPENQASIELHKQHGFREVGLRKRLGKMEHGPYKGQWRDVLLMERRSDTVGV